jgi:hypothetical protein
VSDNILPSQNPALPNLPEQAGAVPQPPPTDGKPSATQSPALLQETPLTPEEREWVRQQFPVEEMEDGVREVQEQGGFAFEDFFEDLVEAVRNGRDHA